MNNIIKNPEQCDHPDIVVDLPNRSAICKSCWLLFRQDKEGVMKPLGDIPFEIEEWDED